jgi:uncharacterized damage-inducible protein DinB
MPVHVPPAADERTALLGFLDHQRQVVRTATYGLTDEEAASTPSPSALSLGGIVKHLTQVERSWMDTVRATPRSDPAEYMAGFRFSPADGLDAALADYAQAALETEKLVADIEDLGHPVPVPREVPWFSTEVDAWSLRWVLLHLIEETARHAGHADIVRESLDGASSISLIAAAEQWPADGPMSGFVQPWKRDR